MLLLLKSKWQTSQRGSLGFKIWSKGCQNKSAFILEHCIFYRLSKKIMVKSAKFFNYALESNVSNIILLAKKKKKSFFSLALFFLKIHLDNHHLLPTQKTSCLMRLLFMDGQRYQVRNVISSVTIRLKFSSKKSLLCSDVVNRNCASPGINRNYPGLLSKWNISKLQ